MQCENCFFQVTLTSLVRTLHVLRHLTANICIPVLWKLSSCSIYMALKQ